MYLFVLRYFFGTSGYTVSTVKTYNISLIGFTITYIDYITTRSNLYMLKICLQR